MKDAMFWLLAFCGFAAVLFVCVIFTCPQLAAVWPSIQEKIDSFHRLPPLAKVALLVFIAGFIAYGSTKTNQVGGLGLGLRSTMEENILCTTTTSDYDYPPPPVTPEDIARGWQLWEVRTNCNISYAMPESATLATNWWVRGAYEDVKPFDFGSWRFPFGTNEYDSVWAFSWGKVRFALSDTNEIVAVGAPMSAVPYRSRLWSAADTNGVRLVTWENFALNRDTNTPVNAQVELRSTGDFVVRSNEVESVCRRIDPDDYDDDGWQNDDDGDPYCWDESWDDFWQELPEGANTNAYCWIEIRPRWNSYIEFVGDGPSDLSDPYLYGKAGKTYRVLLLIGKTYEVECSRQVDVVGRSDNRIEVSDVGPDLFVVVWPVTFTALEGNGSSFLMRVVPSGLGGTFSWTQHCCSITGYGNQFWWAHERYCYCGGCSASGWYSYEGYDKNCTGGHCGCPYYDDDDPYETQEDDGPYAAGASVEFSGHAVIFEDSYTNKPGEVVARQSTRTTLTCIAHGGETGGTAVFSIDNGAKLVSCSGGSLPVSKFVPPHQKVEFNVVYEGRLPSGSERDIVAKADFTERGTGARHSTVEDELTSVKVELKAKYAPPLSVDLANRHLFGVYEVVKYRHSPIDASVGWEFIKGSQILTQAIYSGDGEVFLCPSRGGECRAVVSYGNADFVSHFRVIEPIVGARNVRVNVSDVVAERGHAGQLLMFMDMYLLPNYVSFKGLWIQEVPDDSQGGNHFGYYDNQSKGGDWSHVADLNYGAGMWNETSASGYYATDKAGTARSYAGEWTYGWKEWDIPMAWAANGNGDGSEMFNPSPTTQKFTLWPDGTFKIEKHDHWAQRTIWNDYVIDGVSVLEVGY